MIACSRGMGSVTAPAGKPDVIGLAPGAADGFESMLSAGRADAVCVGTAAARRPRDPPLLGAPESVVL